MIKGEKEKEGEKLCGVAKIREEHANTQTQ